MAKDSNKTVISKALTPLHSIMQVVFNCVHCLVVFFH